MNASSASSMRVVMHAHSTWSYDGRWDLGAIARLYGRLGVGAVMMTEHDTGFDPASMAEYRAECAAASTARCTLIPGIEYSSPDNDIHILTWGLEHFLAEHRPVMETLQNVQAAGGVAIFAHPVRRDAYAAFDPAWVPYLAAIELWNRKSDGIVWGPEALELITQSGLPASVGQDFHRINQLYPLTMAMSLPAKAASADLEQALVTAIQTGAMQPQAFRRPLLRANGTPGPAIHQTLERGRAVLRDFKKKLRPAKP